MKSFKVLHLPWLAFQEIMKTMDFIPLFNLSLVSNRMYLNIKLARRKISPVKLIIANDSYLMQITDEKGVEGRKTVFKLNFFLRKNVSEQEKSNLMIRGVKFGEQLIEISEQCEHRDTFPGFFGSSDNENFFAFFRLLQDLFVCPGTFLMIDKSLQFEQSLANLVGFNILSVEVQKRGSSIWSEQEVSMLLDYTKPTLQLYLRCALTSNFNDKSVLNYPRIRIIHAKWLKIEDIMATNCSTIILDNHNFTQNDLKQYIQHWLSGNDQSLVRFQCGKLDTTPDWDEILEDVEYSNWNETKHIIPSIASQYWIAKKAWILKGATGNWLVFFRIQDVSVLQCGTIDSIDYYFKCKQ